MSENLESTQPSHLEDTQPTRPVNEGEKTHSSLPSQPLPEAAPKKTARWRGTVLSVFAILLLLGLASFGGYVSALNIRQNTEKTMITSQLEEEFTRALVDIQFQHYETARQRLEFIIAHDPSFPGAAQKLAEVLVSISVPTPTPTPTLTPTPDLRGVEAAFTTAQQLIAAGDWANALAALDQVRKMDPHYKTGQVDGMYYFALRNQGVDLINKQGNLEGGIYYLTLAERFGPLDNTALGLREGARAYLTGASFWELNWEQAVLYFSQVAAGWPGMWDGTMTASARYHYALMRYGDQLFAQNKFCDAYAQYTAATSFGELDKTAAQNASQAYALCYPPTETPSPTSPAPIPTETPTPGTP